METIPLFLIECGVVLGAALSAMGVARLARLPGPSTLAVAAATLAVLALVMRRGDLSAIGLLPVPPILDLALWTAGGFGLVLLMSVTGQVAAAKYTGPPNIERLAFVRGNVAAFAGMLLVVWTTAAFGEEIIFRGFLQTGLIEQFGGGFQATAVAILVQAVLFGAGHAYQGPGGIVTTTLAGLALGILTASAGGNLWPAILVHGLVNTVMLTVLFFQPRGQRKV